MKNKVLRIIDVNINRAMEGLRVVEDIVRLMLDKKNLTQQLKHHRSKLRKVVEFLPISRQELLSSRRAGDDIGRELYPDTEGRRDTITQIVTSNFKRSEESLRVLEEAVKLFGSKYGRSFKSLRFKLYDLDKEITLEVAKFEAKKVKEEKLKFDLYAISDDSVLYRRSHEDVIRKLAASGIRFIQLRGKKLSKNAYLKAAKKARKLTNGRGISFIVNDHIDIAKKVDADGIHLGQGDISVSAARNILGEDKIIGVSTHSLKQAIKAERAGADYISVGPIFSTPSKPGRKPIGLKLLRKVRSKVKIPIVAIGGIDASNIHNVRKTGVKRAAVIRAIAGESNIKKAVGRLRSKRFR